MTEEKTQIADGVVSKLNAELGLKVGDKALVVFKPNFLHNPEDGIVVECRVDVIEQTIKTNTSGEESSKKYIVSFGLESTTVTDDVLFCFDKKQQANELAKSFLTQGIESAKNRVKRLEAALLLLET